MSCSAPSAPSVPSVPSVLLLALLCVSAAKTAHISREGSKNGDSVVPFMSVYNKSLCMPREVLVDISHEYPDEVEHMFIPSCVVLMRCGGCCLDESRECVPTDTYNITMEVKRFKHMKQKSNFLLSFTEHRRCECSLKKEVIEKKEIHCPPCSGRRKSLFVQDPLTCQCTCRVSELDCTSQQLELNERTCRCGKPRR